MNIFFGILIFCSLLEAKNLDARAIASDRKRVYLDLEPDDLVPVWNYKNCQKEKPACQSLGLLDQKSEVFVLGQKTVVSGTVKPREEKYFLIYFKYFRNGRFRQGTGWIEFNKVSEKPIETFFGSTSRENIEILKISNKLLPVVGFCGAQNLNASLQPGDRNSYDDFVLPKLQKLQFPKVRGENGKLITRTQLIEIDALARTLYGEMSGCFNLLPNKGGLQYPFAVAKVAINRGMSKERRFEFIRGTHDATKSDLAKVLTSSSQFNNWSFTQRGQLNPSLLKSLCPPQKEGNPYWKKNEMVSIEEFQIWRNSLRIATEAILFPNKFQSRTEEVTELFFTSGEGKFRQLFQTFPTINSRKIENNSCVELWNENHSGSSR